MLVMFAFVFGKCVRSTLTMDTASLVSYSCDAREKVLCLSSWIQSIFADWFHLCAFLLYRFVYSNHLIVSWESLPCGLALFVKFMPLLREKIMASVASTSSLLFINFNVDRIIVGKIKMNVAVVVKCSISRLFYESRSFWRLYIRRRPVLSASPPAAVFPRLAQFVLGIS